MEDPKVLPEDKVKITELLKKPWNPYIRRHSALTEKSQILKENVLRQYAGWSMGSNMPQKYVHYFGNEANQNILEAYGLKPKFEEIDKLKPRQCPNCNELNKIDSKFCVKCRMVLSYDSYMETIQDNSSKFKDEIEQLKHEHVIQMKERESELVKLVESKLSKLTKAYEFGKELDQQYMKEHIPGYKPPKPVTEKQKEFMRKNCPNVFR